MAVWLVGDHSKNSAISYTIRPNTLVVEYCMLNNSQMTPEVLRAICFLILASGKGLLCPHWIPEL